jgi:hypothetical protein
MKKLIDDPADVVADALRGLAPSRPTWPVDGSWAVGDLRLRGFRRRPGGLQ